MLQQFERRVGGDPRPHDARPLEVGKDAEPADRQGQRASSRRGTPERRAQRVLLVPGHIAQELEGEMNPVGPHPFHREPEVSQRRGRLPERLANPLGKIQGDEKPQEPPARSRIRLPRR